MKMCVPLTLSGSLSPDLLTKPLFGSQGPCSAQNVVLSFHSSFLFSGPDQASIRYMPSAPKNCPQIEKSRFSMLYFKILRFFLKMLRQKTTFGAVEMVTRDSGGAWNNSGGGTWSCLGIMYKIVWGGCSGV